MPTVSLFPLYFVSDHSVKLGKWGGAKIGGEGVLGRVRVARATKRPIRGLAGVWPIELEGQGCVARGGAR